MNQNVTNLERKEERRDNLNITQNGNHTFDRIQKGWHKKKFPVNHPVAIGIHANVWTQ